MPRVRSTVHRLDADALGATADDYVWLQQPGAVASALTGSGR